MQKTYEEQFRIEKVIKKVMIVYLIVRLIRKMLLNEISWYKISQYRPKPYGRFAADISVKIDI